MNRKFPAFYGTWKFITVFARLDHWTLSSFTRIQSTHLQPISLRSIWILSFHPCLSLRNGLLPWSSPTKMFYTFQLSMHATCSTYHHSWCYHSDYTCWSSSLCNFLHPLIIFTFLGPNVLLSALFSDALICFLPWVKDHVSPSSKGTGKIMGLYILIFGSLDSPVSIDTWTSTVETVSLNNLRICAGWRCSGCTHSSIVWDGIWSWTLNRAGFEITRSWPNWG
jgi:hypothetical protein